MLHVAVLQEYECICKHSGLSMRRLYGNSHKNSCLLLSHLPAKSGRTSSEWAVILFLFLEPPLTLNIHWPKDLIFYGGFSETSSNSVLEPRELSLDVLWMLRVPKPWEGTGLTTADGPGLQPDSFDGSFCQFGWIRCLSTQSVQVPSYC